jgi:endonuclease YncB( thermonuclease family)
VHGEWASVVRVIDGDTVEPGTGRRVRCLGLNIPERDQPFHEEAKEANRQLVEGRLALLEFDVTP